MFGIGARDSTRSPWPARYSDVDEETNIHTQHTHTHNSHPQDCNAACVGDQDQIYFSGCGDWSKRTIAFYNLYYPDPESGETPAPTPVQTV